MGGTNLGSYVVKESATADTGHINPRRRTARYWDNKALDVFLKECA